MTKDAAKPVDDPARDGAKCARLMNTTAMQNHYWLNAAPAMAMLCRGFVVARLNLKRHAGTQEDAL
jgi:hypothetical protein